VKRSYETATAFAPATVANVTVGFDVLGFAVEGIGDRVTGSRNASAGVRVESIDGVVTELPTDPARNTAAVALQALLDDRGLPYGLDLRLHKGIPLASGMGGSAASAVAAVVAANALLETPLEREELLPCALAGEAVAGGAPHADNVAPSLFGGLTAVVASDPPEIVSIPVLDGLRSVLVHPHLQVETAEARKTLRQRISLAEHVEQSKRLSGFLAGCFLGDRARVAASMVDTIVEPLRARRIPGFDEARTAALGAGALAFGVAGSGPSVFAWVTSVEAGARVEAEVRRIFGKHGVQSDGHLGAIDRRGARIETAGG
jgi:homoserine kinase